MPFKLYNFLTHKKQIFKPSAARRGKLVSFYACGPTVYNFAHIGNLRTYINEDILRRILALNGFKVKEIMNITDVDDKTIKDSKKAGESLEDFTRRFEAEFFKDLKTLNILPALKYPRATDHISEMIKIIRTLLKRGLAYEAGDGVYFDVSKFKNYGRLSRLKNRELKTGARVSSDDYAKDEAKDFTLWKLKKEGEVSWPSPFGEGRPGWHIECSAMSVKYLGMPIDIHAGGIDLIFPHHENEIAQSEAAMGKKFARFFVEGEMMTVDGRKMSKSLGNVFTLRDLESRGFDPLDFRYFTLTAHYRSPLSFSWRALEGAKTARHKLEARALDLISAKKRSSVFFQRAFLAKLNDDLNIPGALGLLWRHLDSGKASYGDILFADMVLGLGLSGLKPLKIVAEVKRLLNQREMLRQEKKWSEADAIRAKIEALGYELKDTPAGPRVTKKK